MKVHLIDGTYELFRAFYGGPKSTRGDGREVGATRTLLRSLLALLKDPQVTHVACAFDHVIESFRNDLFEGYKTGAGIDPTLFSQFELAERTCELLGVVTWPMVEFEADDAMATAAAICSGDARCDEILLCSPDKDLAQCVEGDRVVLFDRMRKQRLNEAGVLAKFGVPPRLIPDYLALVGDTADGIPGIPGWGAKSAAAVLRAHAGIDEIPEFAHHWQATVRGALTLATNLQAERERAKLYRVLATLRRDVPLNCTVDDLEWRVPDAQSVQELGELTGERELAAKLDQLTKARAQSTSVQTTPPS